MLAVPWYFAQQQQSERFNLLYAIVTFVTLFWGLFAGTLVDRFPRKPLFLGTNMVELVLVGSIAAIGWYQEALPWYLIILVFGITIFGYHLHYPNLYAFAQEITPPERYRNVTSTIEIVGQSTNVLAGVLAAILLEGVNESFNLLGTTIQLEVAPWTIWQIFTLDACTYGLSILLISLIQYTPVEELEVERGNVWERMRTGLRFLRNNRKLFWFGLSSYAVFVVMLVKLHAIMPIYITNHLKAGGKVFGAMEMLYALGALTAGLFIRRIFARFSAGQGILLLMVLATSALLLSAFSQSVPLYLAVGLMIGLSNAGIRVLRLAYLFEEVPNNRIGRVNSVFSVINILQRSCFIGLFSLAFFNQGSNITYAYLILAVFVGISAAILAISQRQKAAAISSGN